MLTHAATQQTVLRMLFERFDSIDIHAISDEGDVTFSGVGIDTRTGTRLSLVRTDPDLLVLALAGIEPKKRCDHCRKKKGLGEFATDKRIKSGKTNLCLRCNAKRINKCIRGRAGQPTQAARPSVARKARTA